MQLRHLNELVVTTVKPHGKFQEKTADFVSGLFLLFALILAGSGSVAGSSYPGPAVTQSGSVGVGHGQRSKPVISSQQLLLFEARDISATASDDGKPKAVLAPAELHLPVATPVRTHDVPIIAGVVSSSAAPFNARAPPNQS